MPKRIRITRYARLMPMTLAAALGALLISSNGCGRSFFNEISGLPTQTVPPSGSTTATATGATATATAAPTATAAAIRANPATTPAQTPWAAQFVYASNFTDATISEFSRADDTGALAVIGKASAGAVNGPMGIAIHPSGKFLYVANQADKHIYEFAIGGDGKLSPIPGAGSIVAGAGPQMVALDSTASWLYLTTSSGSIFQFSIDRTSGALTSLGNPVSGLGNPFGIVAHPSQRFVYVADNAAGLIYAFTINAGGTLAQNGAPVASNTTSSGRPGLMAIVADSPSQTFLFAEDLTTGVVSEFAVGSDGRLTPGTTFGTPRNGKSVGIGVASQTIGNRTSNYLFTADADANSIQLFNRDAGSLTAMGSAAAADARTGVLADPEGKFIYTADSASGTITQIAIKGGCGQPLCAVATFPAENPPNVNAGTQFLAATP